MKKTREQKRRQAELRRHLRAEIESLGFLPPDPKTEHLQNTPTQLRKRLYEIRSFGYSDARLREFARNPTALREDRFPQTP